MEPRLLFVYNADAGLVNGLLDLFHKILSPGTYPCSLCGITYGPTTMRAEWKQFLQTLPVRPLFLHRDEFLAQFPSLAPEPLPAAFLERATGTWELFLSKAELDRTDLPGLMQLVRQRLAVTD